MEEYTFGPQARSKTSRADPEISPPHSIAGRERKPAAPRVSEPLTGKLNDFRTNYILSSERCFINL